jgi:anaerobic magnesium-protoporphyrin IX monomethyl ester cyclase
MKLGLVYFPFRNEGVAPPLGLVSLATYLKANMGFSDTRIIDMDFEDPLQVIRDWRPDVIGISAMSVSYGRLITLAKRIREVTSAPILIGGVHISTLPDSMSEVFDIGVIGEGEETLLELMQLFQKEGSFPKEKLKGIKGIIFHDGGKLVATGARALITPLDRIPPLDRSFMSREYFKKHIVFWGEETYCRAMDIMTSRGCPYRCAFCSTALFWQSFRQFSQERVFEDIRSLVADYGVDHINIVDDLFVCNKERVRAVKDRLKEAGLLKRLTFNCTARVNVVDEELCQLLKEMNVTSLNFGFESGSDRTLKILKKDEVTVERTKAAVRLCRKHDFHISGGIILGSPGETLADMRQTVDLIRWMADEGVDILWVYVMTPYPGTAIWEIAKSRGKVRDDMDWERDGEGIADPKRHLLLDDSISEAEFLKVWDAAYAELERMRKPRLRRRRLIMRLMYEPVKTLRLGLHEPLKALTYMRRTLLPKRT